MRDSTLTFRTVVVATDLSRYSSTALRYAQAIAHEHQSTLVLVHVIDPVSYAFPKGAPDVLAANQAALKELRQIEEDARRQGITVHSVVESGVICERILQAAADHHGDLLVLGTRAKTEAGRVALGTMARQLLAKASCPVLTVSPGAEAFLSSAGRWRRVVAAIDFSAASVAALHIAHGMVRDQLLVLHATRCGNEHCCSNCLERLRFLAPLNESHTVPVEHVVMSGDAGEVIASRAENLRADLVVLGSPENELSAEDFLLSTVLQVISRVSCPVLCVPPSGNPASSELIKEIAFA
ncbi:universal stress protein [Paracidobacterium acidisoli]|uniref:Universal stress protein n=1 Tax=Paracidobacterium acidisoli TaxID=2303751 RepID=A0A372IJN6_9BACT|nr:universal stress protein [Paracidobacterium acidisoli]MBT9333382.1 universal stress protein [Paracidobacterium acidisoli]